MTTDTIGDNVKVCVRTRTCMGAETQKKKSLTALPSQNAILLDCKPDPKLFSFDYVADEQTSQEEIFERVAMPIVDAHVDGYHGCVFAYGQTGSGKSFTIVGAEESGGVLTSELRGLIPRTFQYLFKKLSDTLNGTTTYKCTLSFLEIYNEHIIDLLDHTQTNLSIREDLKRGVYVEGLREVEITSPQSAMELLQLGTTNRHVAATAMNSNSSRSHSVMTLNLESTIKSNDGLTKTKYSRLCLIDLAGSERQKSTEAAGSRLKEAGNINKSLSVLGNVIRSLVDVANGKPRHVQYRDSKLTFLLKDSLGGNSKTYIIATVSPSELYYNETLSTLQFAQRAKHVRNIAIVNEEASGNVTLLQMEIRRLKEELYRVSNNQGHNHHHQPDAQMHTINHMLQPMLADPMTQPYLDRIYDLEVLLSRTLDREEKLEEISRKIMAKNNALKLLLEKKDHFLQSTKFVLKLRESHIARLSGKTVYTTYEEDLKEEVNTLKSQVALHPEVTRFAIENLELRELLKNYENSFREGKDGLEDQISNYKQQIQELVAEAKHLMNEKNQLSSKLQNGQFKSPIKQQPSSPSTPYLERQKYKEMMDNNQLQWEKEKKEIEHQYQIIHQQNINMESEYQAMKSSLEQSRISLHDIHSTHEKEVENIKNSHENLIRLLKNAHTLQIDQLKDSNSIFSDESNGLIKDLSKNIEQLEVENQESNNARLKLVSELFEKNEEINRLKIQLDSSQLSNQRMSEVFISTPLRGGQNDSKMLDDDQDEDDNKKPIKLDLGIDQSTKQQELETKIQQLEQQNLTFTSQLDEYKDLIKGFEIDNNILQEEKEILLNEIDTLNQSKDLQERERIDNNEKDDILKSKEIQLLLSKKDEELQSILNNNLQKDNTINLLEKEIKEQIDKLGILEINYQQQTIGLSSRITVLSETLKKKEQELVYIQNEGETKLLQVKSQLTEEWEMNQQKLISSIKEEYEHNITLLRNEINMVAAQKEQEENNSQIQKQFNELKEDYDQMVDRLETYQTTIADQYDEIFKLSERLKNYRGPKYVREEDIIVISSDDDEDDDSRPKYNYGEPDIEEEIDFSKIVIKKNPYEEDSYYDDDDEEEADNGRGVMMKDDIDGEVQLSDLVDESDSIRNSSKRSSTTSGNVSDNAIMSNLSIISQLGELEKSFHSKH